MALVQVLALTLLCAVATNGFSFGCISMDIIKPPTGKMTTAFPGRLTCVRRADGDIWADVYSQNPYVGVMIQVRKRNSDQVVGTFRTARGNNPNPKAVGDLHVVGCTGDGAQYSVDQTPKTETLGHWTDHGSSEDLTNTALDCVFTVVETTQRRYVQIRVPVVRGNSRPTKPNFSTTHQQTQPTQQTQQTEQQRRQQQERERQERERQERERQERERQDRERQDRERQERQRLEQQRQQQQQQQRASGSGGSITVDGHRFPQSCVENGRTRIPAPNSDCQSYYTVTTVNGGRRVRAFQSCGLGMAMSVSSCTCRASSSVRCNVGSSPGQKVQIYNSSNSPVGTVQSSSTGSSNNRKVSLQVTDSTNPSNIPRLSGSSSSSLVVSSFVNSVLGR